MEEKGGYLQAEEHHPIMGVLCCRRDWCTSQIDGFMREEKHVVILKQHLKTSVRKFKLAHKCVYQMDNDPSLLPKLCKMA